MNIRNIQDWLGDTATAVRQEGLSGLDTFWRRPYYKCLHQVDKVQDPGISIFDLEWDLLIILDACRYDLFCEVADDYDFVTDVESIRSVDSMTPAWMDRTFVDERSQEMAETYYLCANPFSQQKLTASDFATLDEVWTYAWDDEVETVTPETVTDRCIKVFRENDPDHVIAHYIQPHWPFVPAMELTRDSGLRPDEFGGYNRDDVWIRLRRGEVSTEEVWEGYRDNLTYALDSVEVLLENIDADNVIVTSDHGNAFGEYGVYGHPMHMPLSCLRSVPYVETSATDHQTREPEQVEVSGNTGGVEDQLEALGYH